MLLTFIWNLLTGTLTWYYLLLSILQNEIWKICWKFFEFCHSPQSSLVLSETFGTKAIVCNIERVSRRDAKHTLRISNWIECVITRTGREVWKFGNMKCREDHSQTGNLCSCENKAWKFQACRDSKILHARVKYMTFIYSSFRSYCLSESDMERF